MSKLDNISSVLFLFIALIMAGEVMAQLPLVPYCKGEFFEYFEVEDKNSYNGDKGVMKRYGCPEWGFVPDRFDSTLKCYRWSFESLGFKCLRLDRHFNCLSTTETEVLRPVCAS